jgi:hypothetical protein
VCGKKKNNKRDDVLCVSEEEIEREKSCFWGYLFASFASFPLSSLSLSFFESHTTRKKRTPLSVSVLFRFLRDDPHSFGAAAATFTRAHETTKQRKQSL